jgi:hypothetical protein
MSSIVNGLRLFKCLLLKALLALAETRVCDKTVRKVPATTMMPPSRFVTLLLLLLQKKKKTLVGRQYGLALYR